MRKVSLSIDIFDLVKSLYFRRKSSMKTEDRSIDDGRKRKALKDFCEPFPDSVSVVLFLTLIVEAVKFVDFSVFMISSEDGDSVFVFYFEKKNVEKCLDRVESSIDIVSHEEIVGILHRRMDTGSFPQI